MNNDIKLLEKHGWEVECESPFEISTKDGSRATGEAANIVLESIRNGIKKLKAPCPECRKNNLMFDNDMGTITCDSCCFTLMTESDDYIKVIEKLLRRI